MLKFTGYFQEVVHEMPAEEYRIRKCIVYFYLEDDSIQVIEPRVENSGVPQGVCVCVCVCVSLCVCAYVRVYVCCWITWSDALRMAMIVVLCVQVH